MKHRATPRFWVRYRLLPPDVRKLADECFARLRRDPHQPSLALKPVGRVWSVRIGLHYRAIATRDDDEMGWFWIGPHSEYDLLLNRQ